MLKIKDQYIAYRMKEDSRVDKKLAEEMWEAEKGSMWVRREILRESFDKMIDAIKAVITKG